jgi:hypothetical protein
MRSQREGGAQRLSRNDKASRTRCLDTSNHRFPILRTARHPADQRPSIVERHFTPWKPSNESPPRLRVSLYASPKSDLHRYCTYPHRRCPKCELDAITHIRTAHRQHLRAPSLCFMSGHSMRYFARCTLASSDAQSHPPCHLFHPVACSLPRFRLTCRMRALFLHLVQPKSAGAENSYLSPPVSSRHKSAD